MCESPMTETRPRRLSGEKRLPGSSPGHSPKTARARGKENATHSALGKLRVAGKVVQVATGPQITTVRGDDDRAVHSFAEEECFAFADFVNTRLAGTECLSHVLPIESPEALFTAVSDGMLLCHLLNVAVPDTIDERAINRINPSNPSKFHINENLNLAINAAKGIGLTVVNIGAVDMSEGRPHLVLGLVWQLVKMSLLSKINLKANPFLIRLLQEGETLEDLLKLPPEELLKRWFNYHLAAAGVSRRVTNFGNDLRDSELYAHLLKQIDPERACSTGILANEDRAARAEYVVAQGRRLGNEFHIKPSDIVRGNEKLNLGFVAGLFNSCPALDPPEEKLLALFDELPDDDVGDSREERAFRMWINSLGIEGTCVNNLFDDVRDGLQLLRVMDHVKPGVVCWSKVNMRPTMVFKRVENLNYAVVLSKGPFKFSLVGVAGKDINDGNRKLTLALIWQLMRAHLVGFLATLRQSAEGGKLSDEEIVRWANERTRGSGYHSAMRDLSDKSLANGAFLLDLLSAIEPRCVNRGLITAGATDEDKVLNAKYAISCARKLGCCVFCLPEDLVEVRPKMILSFVAAVMAYALQH